MQTMERPDGSIFEEVFTGKQVQEGAAKRRRELLESFGMTFRSIKPIEQSKYMPHQGSKEVARRVKQALRQAAKAAEPV